MSLIYGPASGSNGSTKPSNPGITNGEPGYQKRTPSSAGVPEKTRETGNGLTPPTKK